MNGLDKKQDLTRWNRSGLTRFRYIDGNAVTYLEALRQAMAEAFTAVDGEQKWRQLDEALPVQEQESPRQRQARWLQQYHDERRDYAWEILRSHARSLHVLTEHVDAYANETFLQTASQWDNVRRLVAMLDYRPAPPASAETVLALLAKPDKQGQLDAGFAVKNKPDDGSPPVVFETLTAIQVDARLNQLKAKDWNKSQQLFNLAAGVFPLAEPLADVSVGNLGVLVIEGVGLDEIGLAVEITGVSDQALQFTAEPLAISFPTLRLHQVRLLLKPDYRQAPQLSGDRVVELGSDHGLTADAVVAWRQGGVWHSASVEQVAGRFVSLSATPPPTGAELFLTAYSDRQNIKTADGFKDRVILPPMFQGARVPYANWDSALNKLGLLNCLTESGSYLYDYSDALQRIYYIPSVDSAYDALTEVVASSPDGVRFDGAPGELVSDDWVLLAQSSGATAARIKTLNEFENEFSLTLSKTGISFDSLSGVFAYELRPKDYDANRQTVYLTDLMHRSDQHSFIEFDDLSQAELLTVGQSLIVAGTEQATPVVVVAIDHALIKVEPAIPGSGLNDVDTGDYRRHQTIIYGNVAAAGHGERQKAKLLGSGDASQSHQQFIFDVKNLSFIAAAEFGSGVKAAIDVVVEGRTWRQVPNLIDSGPEDWHYRLQMNEDGTTTVIFGDGRQGRRLPTGNNNVRVEYRKGVGLQGNLAAYALVKAVKPHHLIDAVVQPMVAGGGNDMESIASLKENAPASVLALERAVSLDDFSHLATTNSSVWQAKASRSLPGKSRSDKITVAVVPANGGALGTLAETLAEFLTSHALPGVSITIAPYRSIVLDLVIDFTVHEDAFNVDIVADSIRQALLSAFSLRQQTLGANLYRSQVYAVVERVEGVANCHCRINAQGFRDHNDDPVVPDHVVRGADGSIKRIAVADDQLVYMDAALSILELNGSAFTL